MMQRCLYLFIALVFAVSASAEVVVNEVLSNEPVGSTSLEWIELYNDGDQASLAFYSLHVTNDGVEEVFQLSGEIPANSYMVLCRNATRFEEHWGDSSGVWNDSSPLEDFAIQEYGFHLDNDSGLVELYYLQSVNSAIEWHEAGVDGYSWERFYPNSSEVLQSVDVTGSTPGLFNSVSPLDIDLALESVEAWAVDGKTNIAFEIVNRGLDVVDNGILELYYYDPGTSDSLGDLITGEMIGEVDSGGTVILIGQYEITGVYGQLVSQIYLMNDQRPGNNRQSFTAPGSAFPPVAINEYLPAPQLPLATEWIELKNVCPYPIDLANWQIGDALGFGVMTTESTLLNPDEYVVLADDADAFMSFYTDFDGLLIEPEVWRELNNGSDSVRLVDSHGLSVDAVYYETSFEGNHTWSRVEEGIGAGEWGRSEDAGGTPGGSNVVRLTPEESETLSIEVEPRIFAPDGNGIDEYATIRVTSSPAQSYTLKIFDDHGRLVRTLDDQAPDLPIEYTWDGTNDGGERVPIGIYILYFEAEGLESLKKTIVVAR